MTNLLGTSIGRYRLDDLIGRGGMAKVYKAWDPNTQRYVAVKVLHQHLVEEDTFQERFSREGKLIASLNHPNIVSIYDFDQAETENGTLHYMVMPFIDGDSLKDRLQSLAEKGERLSFDRVVKTINGIAAALDYAHAKDMVHRDIKPGNILFDENGSPLLTDFGLARLTFGARITQSGVTSGTPAYMSPEQGKGLPGDPRSDVYSLGIILHEMLTGALPFTAESSLGLIMKHINEPLPSPRSFVPNLPEGVEAVVYRATAKEPADRYQSAGELAEELEAVLEGALISKRTRAVSRRQQAEAAARRRPLWLLVGVLLVAVVVLGVAVLQGGVLDAAAPTPTDPPVMSMTSQSLPFSTGFDADDEFNDGWPITTDGLFTRQIADGAYVIRSQLLGQGHTAVYDPDYFEYGPLIAETHVTLSVDSQPDSGFGLIFRYQDEDNYYVFTVNGAQEVSIWRREAGRWVELRDGAEEWTFNESVAPAGEENYLSLSANENHFVGYVNGQRVVDVEDDTFEEGAVGFYIATTRRGGVDDVLTEVRFDSFSVTNAVPSMGR